MKSVKMAQSGNKSQPTKFNITTKQTTYNNFEAIRAKRKFQTTSSLKTTSSAESQQAATTSETTPLKVWDENYFLDFSNRISQNFEEEIEALYKHKEKDAVYYNLLLGQCFKEEFDFGEYIKILREMYANLIPSNNELFNHIWENLVRYGNWEKIEKFVEFLHLHRHYHSMEIQTRHFNTLFEHINDTIFQLKNYDLPISHLPSHHQTSDLISDIKDDSEAAKKPDFSAFLQQLKDKKKPSSDSSSSSSSSSPNDSSSPSSPFTSPFGSSSSSSSGKSQSSSSSPSYYGSVDFVDIDYMFSKMPAYNTYPDVYTYTLIISLALHFNQLDKAEGYLDVLFQAITPFDLKERREMNRDKHNLRSQIDVDDESTPELADLHKSESSFSSLEDIASFLQLPLPTSDHLTITHQSLHSNNNDNDSHHHHQIATRSSSSSSSSSTPKTRLRDEYEIGITENRKEDDAIPITQILTDPAPLYDENGNLIITNPNSSSASTIRTINVSPDFRPFIYPAPPMFYILFDYYFSHDLHEKADLLFQKMIKYKLKATAQQFALFIRSYIIDGNIDRAYNYYKLSINAGFTLADLNLSESEVQEISSRWQLENPSSPPLTTKKKSQLLYTHEIAAPVDVAVTGSSTLRDLQSLNEPSPASDDDDSSATDNNNSATSV